MSEYQCYEFLALDRSLTKKQRAELRSISTRAEVTATRFVRVPLGDLKGYGCRICYRNRRPSDLPGHVLEREAAILAGQLDAHRTMRRASHGGQPRCTNAAIWCQSTRAARESASGSGIPSRVSCPTRHSWTSEYSSWMISCAGIMRITSIFCRSGTLAGRCGVSVAGLRVSDRDYGCCAPEAVTSCHRPPLRLRLSPLAWPAWVSPM